MVRPRYTASKTLPQGRSSYVMSFRHPLRNDPKTGQGLKVRRGLGTSDEAKADALVAEMNQLLSNERFHSITMKPEAERKFSGVVVSAFYDELENPVSSHWALRERELPLPSIEDGYAKVLLVGTTGAGKTSLLRHLIGSDPDKDRFPSTSTSKTTIADTEIIMSKEIETYQAVVTFLSRATVRTNIHESLLVACLKAKDKATDSKIISSLLNHTNQRFRLSYTLGSWNPDYLLLGNEDEDDTEDDGNPSEDLEDIESMMPTPEEKAKIQGILEGYLKRIHRITTATLTELKEALDGIDLETEDHDTVEELFGENVVKQEDFSDLICDIMDEIQQRFTCLTEGESNLCTKGDWPEVWTYESSDRHQFIAKVRQLSSNATQYFGRLLTPIVEGMRIKGPFSSIFAQDDYKLVLMDGEGLGHTPDSAISVTTRITSRFKDVDIILLVDSATQPMQAAPLSVIRSVVASGYQKKLVIAFTHFDQVKGDNLSGFQQKKEHVLASVTNGLSSLSDALGNKTVRAIERNLDQRCFMIARLNLPLRKAVGEKQPRNQKELKRLLDCCRDGSSVELDVEARPIYDPGLLMYALQAATDDFCKRWDARLGLDTLDGVAKEHWTRIWALSRRMAERLDIEYDTLRPVADLLARLNEGTTAFLSKPTKWTKPAKSEEEEDAVIDAIKQAVDSQLIELAYSRIVEEPFKKWQRAFDYSGEGSSFKRAEEIQMLYSVAAPKLGIVMTEVAREFLNEVRQIVYTAIEENKGQIIVETSLKR